MRVTETGWPTGGSRNFAGHDASPDAGARWVWMLVHVGELREGCGCSIYD